MWHQVFAPNLIRPPGDDLGALVEYTPHSNRTMETLILHYDELLAVRSANSLFYAMWRANIDYVMRACVITEIP